ncbi:MAG: nucleoside-triphosphatase [Sphaerochaetaceae bacterium]|nr:nucleoside-triphosphatase [Spirochaetales bacterium]MDY5500044.1 nucleoside-triphosphatase [Sphaerochaetaceae bacterium]
MQPYSELLISFLVNAYTQGTGWQSIARAVRPFVGGHVADIGGGLGFLANELKGINVTVVERDELACLYLRAHHEPHVHLSQGDAHQLRPERRKGDVICCNYGSLLENLVLARKWGDRNLIVIARDADGHRFRGGTRPNPAQRTRLLLQSLSIPYQEQGIVVDMGQPFRSQEEARAFSRLYGHSGEYDLQRRNGEFPLWLPMVRPISLFFVSIGDIPELVTKSTLLVEGEQGVGKSTFVGKLAACADGGFLTKRVDGKVYLNPIGGVAYDEDHLVGVCGRGGIPQRFDQLGVQLLERPCTLRVMDELGFMESEAREFQKSVLQAAKDPVPTIAVIKPCRTPLLDAIRSCPSAVTIHFSMENRDAWAQEMERATQSIPEWPLCERLRTRSGL